MLPSTITIVPEADGISVRAVIKWATIVVPTVKTPTAVVSLEITSATLAPIVPVGTGVGAREVLKTVATGASHHPVEDIDLVAVGVATLPAMGCPTSIQMAVGTVDRVAVEPTAAAGIADLKAAKAPLLIQIRVVAGAVVIAHRTRIPILEAVGTAGRRAAKAPPLIQIRAVAGAVAIAR